MHFLNIYISNNYQLSACPKLGSAENFHYIYLVSHRQYITWYFPTARLKFRKKKLKIDS